MCVKVCPYSAIRQDPETKSRQVTQASCAGCGTCVAECPFRPSPSDISRITDPGPDRCHHRRNTRTKGRGFLLQLVFLCRGRFCRGQPDAVSGPRSASSAPCVPDASAPNLSNMPFDGGRPPSWFRAAISATAIISMPTIRPRSGSKRSGKKWSVWGWIKTASSWPGSAPPRATSSPKRSRKWTRSSAG